MKAKQWHRSEWSSGVPVFMSLKQRFLSSAVTTQQADGLPGLGIDHSDELKGLFVHEDPYQH